MLALLVVAALAQEAEAPQPRTVASASGRFVAEIAKAAGQERVAEPMARWRVDVFALTREGKREAAWGCVIRHRAGERLHWLSDDGAAFVELDARAADRRELVRLWRGERELAVLDDEALGVGHDVGPWLAHEHGAELGWLETPVGPSQQLMLILADGGHRRVDLETGEVFPSHASVDELAAGPLVDEEMRPALAQPFVKRATAPASVHWGERLEIDVSGSHPTPNWRFVGFDVEREGEGGGTLVLTPQSAPPPSKSPQLQVLEGFSAKAWIAGLSPGDYRVRVVGRGEEQVPEIAVRVLPARALIELTTTGGIMGMRLTTRAFRTGVVAAVEGRDEPELSYFVLDAQDRALIDAAYAELTDKPVDALTPGAADMFEYTLRWYAADGRECVWRFDDGSAPAAGRELVRVLREARARALQPR